MKRSRFRRPSAAHCMFTVKQDDSLHQGLCYDSYGGCTWPPKPRPFLPPIKPRQRLPKGKCMTIAAGFPCKEGLVLCADTQEVISGYVKTDTEKMTLITDAGWTVAITGAGDGDFIEMAIQEIQLGVMQIKPPQTLQSKIRDILLDMFTKRVQPYASFPYEDRPNAQMLIGIQSQGLVGLYKSRGTLFRRIDTAECVGAGIALGKSLIEQLFRSNLSLKQASLVAIYILHQAKKWVDGCGGNSDIILMSKDNLKWARLPTDEVKTLETHFDSFFEYMRPVLIAAADGTVLEPDFDRLLKDFCQRDMLSLRAKFMDTKEFFRRLSEATGIKLEIDDDGVTPLID